MCMLGYFFLSLVVMVVCGLFVAWCGAKVVWRVLHEFLMILLIVSGLIFGSEAGQCFLFVFFGIYII